MAEYQIEVVALKAQPVMVMEREVAPEALGQSLAEILPAVHGYVLQQGGSMTGMPFLRYLGMGATFQIAAGVPVAEPLPATDEILCQELPAGKAATTLFLGEYHRVGEAWNAVHTWCREQGMEAGFGGWDVYENDPSEISNPAELRTRIYQPLPV